MSRNYVGAGRRITGTAAVANKAGDLIYYNGFFGWLQDDVAVGGLFTLIQDGEITWSRPGLVVGPEPMGRKMYAAPTAEATMLKLYPEGSVPSGAVAIGRLSATSATSSGKIILFGDANY